MNYPREENIFETALYNVTLDTWTRGRRRREEKRGEARRVSEERMRKKRKKRRGREGGSLCYFTKTEVK